MRREGEYLFCHCLTVHGREFLIHVSCDGKMHWDDYASRQALRISESEDLEAAWFAGEEWARKRLVAELDEFIITVQLNEYMQRFIREASLLVECGKWTTDHESDLDRHLLPIFWSEVNPYLLRPILSEDSQS